MELAGLRPATASARYAKHARAEGAGACSCRTLGSGAGRETEAIRAPRAILEEAVREVGCEGRDGRCTREARRCARPRVRAVVDGLGYAFRTRLVVAAGPSTLR